MASIEGEIFHRGAIQALAPGETPVTPRLAALVRKQLILHDRPIVPGEDGFRFRHLLIRDAAYDGASESDPRRPPRALRGLARADTAPTSSNRTRSSATTSSGPGRYRAELGLPDNGIAAAGAGALGCRRPPSARASDYGAAVELFGRVAELTPHGGIDLTCELALIDALFWKGEGAAALRRADALARTRPAAE